jgi:hypothetical protein
MRINEERQEEDTIIGFKAAQMQLMQGVTE